MVADQTSISGIWVTGKYGWPGRFRGVVFTVVLWAVVGASALAQTLSVTVSRNPVTVGEQFQVTFSLNAPGTNFSGPAFDDFIVLGGPNASTSIQIINGAMSQTQTFSYFLRAKTEGNFNIGSARVTSGRREYESPPFTINVVKGTSNQATQKKDGQQQPDGEVADEDVFMLVNVNKSTVYRGEGLVATYRLYTRVSLVNYAVTKAPALNGFWTQDIQLPSQLSLTTEVVNGVQYHVGVLKKVVLYPQQSGQLTVDPMEGEVIARVKVSRRNNQRDPFDVFNDPFFNNPFGFGSVRDVKVKIRSKPVIVRVKELPPNAPPSFKGSVGNFSFKASLDKNETRANEPVTLRIEIKGSGNLNLLDPPNLEFPPDIESYDPRVIDNFNTTQSGTSGSKSFEYLLIPRNEGTYQLDPVAFSYFDLANKSYKSVASPAFNLKVLKGSGEGAATMVGSQNKTDVQLIGKDIRFIKTGNTQFVRIGKNFFGSPGFWSITVSPALIFLGLLAFKRRRDRMNADWRSVRSRKANSMARKRLVTAKKMLDQNNRSSFYDETAKALWGFVGDKLILPVSELSKDSARDGLIRRNVSEATISRLMQLLDECEMARFTTAGAATDPQKTYQDTVSVIASLEGETRS